MKKIEINEEVCISCHLCEIWCQVAHSRSKNIIKAFKDENNQPLPRIRVQSQRASSFGIQCRHCEEPICVYSCISGAMYIDEETGAILQDSNKCVECYTCILVCPFGGLTRDENTKYVIKCDFCTETGTPSCVEHCPNEALKIVEVDE